MSGCESYRQASAISRRSLLGLAGIGLAGLIGPSALAQVKIERKRQNNRVLVSLFLRGGMDGLNAIVPTSEDAYYRARPGLGIAKKSTLRLDDAFGFNPNLAGVQNLFAEGRVAVLHAVGSQDHSRSHFEAMSAMERGAANAREGDPSGWLARHLARRPHTDSPLTAVAFGSTLPDSLKGSSALSLESLQDYKLAGGDAFRTGLSHLYREPHSGLAEAGRGTLKLLDLIGSLDPLHYRPERGADYPDTELGRGFKQTAFLIKANMGLEVAALDMGGWDTHVAQEPILNRNLKEIDGALSAFYKDLGALGAGVTTVVQTEFGRRVSENTGLGTDHGRASVMMVLGGGVKGGKMYGEWPGLTKEAMEDEMDLRVATDYRAPLSEALAHVGGSGGEVFAGFDAKPLGLFAS